MKKPKRKPVSRHVIVLGEIRRAVADYMSSEGCSCCQNVEAHEDHAERLAKLLGVTEYADGSGYDFYRFRTKK